MRAKTKKNAKKSQTDNHIITKKLDVFFGNYEMKKRFFL